MNNIFDDAMAANEFVDAITDKIAHDWQEEGIESTVMLFRWIQGGLADSLTEAVRKKVEG